MRCIFCKLDSTGSKSIEHIIPESLGNKTHILKAGTVCDKCNNYFATKVEKEVLSQPYFQSLRHRNYVVNKKNKLPHENAFMFYNEKKTDVKIIDSFTNNLELIIENKEHFELLVESKIDKIYIPIVMMPDTNSILLSRLIGKIAIEALAYRVCELENWNIDFVENESLDELRDFVRYGKGKIWPYKVRKINSEDSNIEKKPNEANRFIQKIHESDFLFIEYIYIYILYV